MFSTKKTLGIALFAMIPLALPALSSADSGGKHGKRGKGIKACKADIEKHCGEVEPGEGRIKACIEANRSQFSEGCQQQLAKHTERRAARKAKRAERKAAFEAACGADVQSFCSDAEGRRETKACMKENKDQLSQTCTEFIETARAERKGKRKGKRGKKHGKKHGHWKNLSEEDRALAKQLKKEVKSACEADRETWCGEAEGRRAVRQCMASNRDKFSVSCTDAIDKMKAFKESVAP